MKKYLLVFRGDYPDEPPDGEAMEAEMKEWGKWYGMLKGVDGIVDPGHPVSKGGKVLTQEGVRDGSVESNGAWIGYYIIIQAKDIDDALHLTRQCPAAKSFRFQSSIEIRELQDMPAM